MKGFKATGNGPRSGFSFPSNKGFGPSSGKVKSISGYTRKTSKKVMKKAIGGIVEDNIVESPGFSDYAKGGVLKKAKGGKVAGVSDPMTAREAMKGSVGFNSTPKIRK